MSSTPLTVAPRIQVQGIDHESLQRVILGGDLSTLRTDQKVQYYKSVCDLIGINPTTKPFDYLKLNGKEVLYANKGCAEQLRMLYGISVKISSREKIDEVYVVTAEASNKEGRVDSSTGAVPLKGLTGESLANAMMKAETKAKRRVTLSICGLNMLDETEVESIRNEGPGFNAKDINADLEGNGTIVDNSTDYRVPFGKYAKRSLEDVGPDDLASYVDYLESTAAKKGHQITGQVADFIERASSYIRAFESRASER